jgi:peptidyl-prolyl cis-trans isomerase SurA
LRTPAWLILFALIGTSLAGPADSIVAAVGNELIMASEVAGAVDFLRVAYPDTTVPDSVLHATVIERMIDDFVLQEQARRESIEVTAAEVAAEVDASIAALVERFGGEDGFRAALAEEGMAERALRQRYGDEARRKLLARRLLEKTGLTQIYVSPGEAERFYAANRDSIARVPGRVTLEHILLIIKPAPESESAGVRRTNEVIDVLARGGDFATVAGSFSDDTRTRGRGGDWGVRPLSELPPDVALVAAQLKPGEIAPPFRTLEGYLLLRLEERRGERVRLRSILIRIPVTRADTARTRNLAESIRRRSLAGASFDSLARSYSDDPETREAGGFLGEFLAAGLAPPFNQVVAGLDSGSVSEPVLSDHGFHLVRAARVVPERMMSYLEMQDGIRNYIYQQRLNERMAEYVARIRRKTYIRRFDGR